jgi:hypothetical protein
VRCVCVFVVLDLEIFTLQAGLQVIICVYTDPSTNNAVGPFHVIDQRELAQI